MPRQNIMEIGTGTKVFLVAMVLLIVGAIVYIGSGSGASHTQSFGINYGQPTTSIAGSLGCPTGNPTYSFSVLVRYPAVIGGVWQLSAASSQTVSIYAPGLAAAQNVITSASTAVATGSLPGNCNTVWFADVGDQATYFLNGVNASTGPGNATRTLYLNTLRYSTPTIYAANVNNAGSLSTTGATFHSVSSASGGLTGYIAVGAGQYNDSDNAPSMVYVLYNSLAISASSINFDGLTPMTCGSGAIGGGPAQTYVTSNTGTPSLSGVGAQNACLQFMLPEIHNSQYSTGIGGVQGQQLLPITITPGANFATNELIGIEITPATGYYNTAGATSRFQWPVYVNPTNGQNIFAPVINSNIIILNTH